MRVEFELPDGRRLALGHDHAVGFFATLQSGMNRAEYGAIDSYDHAHPLDGLLRWLIAREVFSEDDLEEALLVYADQSDDDDEPLSSPEARLALTIIETLKRAAAE